MRQIGCVVRTPHTESETEGGRLCGLGRTRIDPSLSEDGLRT